MLKADEEDDDFRRPAVRNQARQRGCLPGLLGPWPLDGRLGCFSGVVPSSSSSSAPAAQRHVSPAPSADARPSAASKLRRAAEDDGSHRRSEETDPVHIDIKDLCQNTDDCQKVPSENSKDLEKEASRASCRSRETDTPFVSFGSLVGDSLEVPWFQEDDSCCSGGGVSFVSSYFVKKEVSADGTSYEPGETSFHEGDDSYPPLTFNRRVTTNTWQSMLAGAMLEAGLRLTSLQANLKLLVDMFFNAAYAEVAIGLKILFAGLYAVGVLTWVVFGLITAYSYRDFIHPDNWLGELTALGSSALLSMFAMPNDIVLMAIHVLPQRHGGLLMESNCIQGNKCWPVHTIAHHCKADHDYTNWSGSKVQLPLFIFIDVGCSFIVVYISFVGGILNFTVIFQMSSTFLYAFYRVYVWGIRWRLRRRLFKIWLDTCCDPLLPETTRRNVMAKYIAEGGNRAMLQKRLREAGVEGNAVPHSRRSKAMIQMGLRRSSGRVRRKSEVDGM